VKCKHPVIYIVPKLVRKPKASEQYILRGVSVRVLFLRSQGALLTLALHNVVFKVIVHTRCDRVYYCKRIIKSTCMLHTTMLQYNQALIFLFI